MNLRIYCFSLLFLFSFSVLGQDVSGLIIDEKTNESLAFVNIVYNKRLQGLTSNIDGKFEIPNHKKVEFLKISYVGYYPKEISLEQIRNTNPLIIKLKSKTFNIEEVTVVAGENPAHRIIRKVVKNRKLNDPEKLSSFSYTMYNKMVFTIEKEDKEKRKDSTIVKEKPSKKIEITINDTANDTTKSKENSDDQDFDDFLKKSHLFLTEAVTKREYIHPAMNKEKVVASRVSGFKNPTFTLLSTQMQSFSFYEDNIIVFDKIYLNPISRGSTRKYYFQIEDTTYSEKMDTVFVISYRPKKGKNFDGLKGVLNINTRGYAVESAIAEPAEESDLEIKIQQKYSLIDDSKWFPIQLNTDIKFQNGTSTNVDSAGITTKSESFFIGTGKSYLKEIKLNPKLNKRDFNHIAFSIEKGANKKEEIFWNKYRVDTLTAKEKETYVVLDSIGKEADFDNILKITQTVLKGYIPYKCFDINFLELIRYNQYEGFRFGLGFVTNERLCDWFSVGANFGYGLKDEAWKYGGKFRFLINDTYDLSIGGSYKKDVEETGGYSFLDNQVLTSSDMYRDYLIKDMDKTEEIQGYFTFRALQYMKAKVSLSQIVKSNINDYFYKEGTNPEPVFNNKFNFTEVGFSFRYAFREKFMQTPAGKISMGTKYPVIWGNILRGVNFWNGDYEYTKYELKLTKSFISKSLGQTYIQLVGGYIDGNLPYGELYNGHGSYYKFTVETSNSFGTMRMNEFLSDRFAAVYLKHDFASLLYKGEKFRPEIALVTNFTIGDLKNSNKHLEFNNETNTYLDYPIKTLEKGYWESGILFNKLIKNTFIYYGVGVFYRYGAYAFDKISDNFAYKLSISFGI